MKITLLLSVLLFCFSSWARPEVEIAAVVEVSQRQELRLSDIVSVRNATSDMLNIMDRVVLREDSRDLLINQSIDSQEITKKLRDIWIQNRVAGAPPVFKIPAKVKIEFSARALSRQEFERKALNKLRVQCASCEHQVSIQSLPETEMRKWNVDWSPLAHAKGSFLLSFDDGSTQKKWISGSFKVFKKVPVAARFISQNEKLEVTDLSFENRDVTFAKDDILKTENLNESIASRTLSKGQIVWSSDLKKEPALKRGQIIKALIGSDDFEISLSVQAEEAGQIGDVIRVKNLETKKILSGVVIEKGMVRLQ